MRDCSIFLSSLYQLSATKTTEENYFLTTDLKEALYDASYKVPPTRKMRLETNGQENSNFTMVI